MTTQLESPEPPWIEQFGGMTSHTTEKKKKGAKFLAWYSECIKERDGQVLPI